MAIALITVNPFTVQSVVADGKLGLFNNNKNDIAFLKNPKKHLVKSKIYIYICHHGLLTNYVSKIGERVISKYVFELIYDFEPSVTLTCPIKALRELLLMWSFYKYMGSKSVFRIFISALFSVVIYLILNMVPGLSYKLCDCDRRHFFSICFYIYQHVWHKVNTWNSAWIFPIVCE